MKLEEAAAILGLKGSTSYTREELEEAVREAEMRAQNAFRLPQSRESQDAATNKMGEIQEAAHVLRGAVVGGTLAVPG